MSKKLPPLNRTDSFAPNVVVAPSWGVNCLVESGMAKKIINKLLALGCNVTLRPHPETIKHANEKITDILKVLKAICFSIMKVLLTKISHFIFLT